MTRLNLPSTLRIYQISIIDYVPSDRFFAWGAMGRGQSTHQVPWAGSHLYSRCRGVYSGMTSLNFGGPQVLELVITNPGSHPRMAHSPWSTCLGLSFRVPQGKCDLLHLYVRANETGTRHAVCWKVQCSLLAIYNTFRPYLPKSMQMGEEGRRRQSKHKRKFSLLLQMLNDPGKQSQPQQAWISRLRKSLGALERSNWAWTQAIRV